MGTLRALGLFVFWLLSVADIAIKPSEPHAQVGNQSQSQSQIRDLQRQLNELQQMQLPTANGQESWMLSSQDIGQNIKIDEINDHLKAVDGRDRDYEQKQRELEGRINTMDGREGVWFVILGGIVMAAIGYKKFLEGKGE